MASATTAAAVQYRLKEWAEQIRECQNRPAGMSAVDWCATQGITKANYYYRLRCVRQACLENLPPEGCGTADRSGKHLHPATENAKRQRYTAGAFHFCKWFFHPRNGIHTHAAASIIL